MNQSTLTTTDYPVDAIIFAEYNPRQLSEAQHQDLTDSIKRFGLVDPLIINTHKDRKNILIGGHQRCKIAKELKYKTVPCVEVSLTPDKERELNIRLNRNTGEWDWDALANYFDVEDLTDWGFTDDELQFWGDEPENRLSRSIEVPVYEPKNEKPPIDELFDSKKTKELIKVIENSSLSTAEKEFLKKASERHIVFNYSKIADYYANSDKEVQELMEDSALVIIDYNKAIESGFVEMNKKIRSLYGNEYG